MAGRRSFNSRLLVLVLRLRPCSLDVGEGKGWVALSHVLALLVSQHMWHFSGMDHGLHGVLSSADGSDPGLLFICMGALTTTIRIPGATEDSVRKRIGSFLRGDRAPDHWKGMTDGVLALLAQRTENAADTRYIHQKGVGLLS